MKKKTQRTVSISVVLLMLLLLPVQAFAEEYNIANGNITVTAGSSGQSVSQGSGPGVLQTTPTVITGSSDTKTVTITAETGYTAEVTLKDVNIDRSDTSDAAALLTGGDGNVNIELDGDNTLQSGNNRAGLEKGNAGTLTIGDDNDTAGSLTATSDGYGAGIGAGQGGNASYIIITGGEIEANGGTAGAGIGGGKGGDGSYIEISGGEVTANGGEMGAGIGGGEWGDGHDITITGGTVTANGGGIGAGIGGGMYGDGSNITITGGTVTATGGDWAAGIGGGGSSTFNSGGVSSIPCNGYGISITGGEVTAVGGSNGAGIGGGYEGIGSGITVSGDAQVRVQGGAGDASDGAGAGIGNGGNSDVPYSAYRRAINGAEIIPDTSNLTTAGWVKYYAPGADMNKDSPMRTIGKLKVAIGMKMFINGTAWIVAGIEGDMVELVSDDAFTEEQLKDLEALVKNLLAESQLGKLAADKATGERVFLADDDIAKKYFGGEKGHIVIRADKSILW